MAKPTVHWQKRILFPLWAIRSCLLLVMLIGFSAAIGLHEVNASYRIKYSVAAAFLTCIMLILLLDVAQIVLWARNQLHAKLFVGLTMVQTLFWGLVLILDIVGIAVNDQSPRGIGMIVVMFLLYLGLFIYAVRGYLRQRKNDVRGYYSPALNPKTSADLERYPGSAHDLGSTEHRTISDDGNDHKRLGGSPSKQSEANQPYSDSSEKVR